MDPIPQRIRSKGGTAVIKNNNRSKLVAYFQFGILIAAILLVFLPTPGCRQNARLKFREKIRQQKQAIRKKLLEKQLSPNGNEVSSAKGFGKEIIFYNNGLALKGHLCKPKGKGPFPIVLYIHGGWGQIGGAPYETCEALKKAGFVSFAPIRKDKKSEKEDLSDTLAALSYVKSLPYVDDNRIGMIGFSRGGTLTYMVAAKKPELKAIVIMAVAPLPGFSTKASDIQPPVLLLVASNDTPSRFNKGKNLVTFMRSMEADLKASGTQTQLIIYPPYKNNGHLMFFEVGRYFNDVKLFLNKHLK